MEKPSIIWKVLHVLRAIQERPGLTARAVAGECGLGERTVYRYVALLRRAGVPIVCDRGYRCDDNLALAAINLNLPEALALVLAGQHFASGKPPLGSPMRQALDKLLTVLPENLRRTAKGAGQRVLMGQEGPIDYSAFGARFGVIDNAVKERLSLSLLYRSLKGNKVSKRLVDPYGMVFRQGFWYLAAYCRERRDMRLFRIDRILKLQPSTETFARRDGFSLAGYMADAWRVEKGRAQEVKVRFRGIAKRLVEEAKWHPSQRIVEQDGDTVVATYRVGGRREIATWLLGFGGEAEVLAPLELRRLVADMGMAGAKANG